MDTLNEPVDKNTSFDDKSSGPPNRHSSYKLSPDRGLKFLGFKEKLEDTVLVESIVCLLRDALARTPKEQGEQQEILMALLRGIQTPPSTPTSVTSFRLSRQELDWISHHDQSQWVRYLIYRFRFKIYPKRFRLPDFPLHLLIEPTSVCNLRCVMCFQIDTSFTKREFMGHMPYELFVQIADQAKSNGCEAVTLASRGEPTLHRDFGRMLWYLSRLGFMDLKINTNATQLNETLIHDILGAGVNEVVFSVDAGTKETYEAIRIRGKFDEVVKNIERFNEIRSNQYKTSWTSTRISGVRVTAEQDEEQMVSFWISLVDQVTIKSASPRWDSYNNPVVDIQAPCTLLWERMYVWYDGKVNPCDFDYKSHLVVGDAKTTPLKDIWLGERYHKLREAHLQRRRQDLLPCDRCPLW